MQTQRERAQKRRVRQQGAVMVEAVMIVGGLVIMYMGTSFMHQLTTAHVRAFQEARAKAWSAAMNGCEEQDVDLRSMATGLLQGRLPVPPSILGVSMSEASDTQSYWDMLRHEQGSARSRVTMPCSPRGAQPSGSAGDWLLDLFR